MKRKKNCRDNDCLRSFDLNKFIKKVEEGGHKEVIGIKFEGNNLELIIRNTLGIMSLTRILLFYFDKKVLLPG